MLKKYSFYGMTLEMILVFGGFALALVLIACYAYAEHRSQRKRIGPAGGKEARG